MQDVDRCTSLCASCSSSCAHRLQRTSARPSQRCPGIPRAPAAPPDGGRVLPPHPRRDILEHCEGSRGVRDGVGVRHGEERAASAGVAQREANEGRIRVDMEGREGRGGEHGPGVVHHAGTQSGHPRVVCWLRRARWDAMNGQSEDV